MTDKRIAVQYAGVEYAIGNRDYDEVLQEIVAGMRASEPRWLDVALGQGRSTPAKLLLGTGIAIAVWRVNTDGADGQPDGPVSVF